MIELDTKENALKAISDHIGPLWEINDVENMVAEIFDILHIPKDCSLEDIREMLDEIILSRRTFNNDN